MAATRKTGTDWPTRRERPPLGRGRMTGQQKYREAERLAREAGGTGAGLPVELLQEAADMG